MEREVITIGGSQSRILNGSEAYIAYRDGPCSVLRDPELESICIARDRTK